MGADEPDVARARLADAPTITGISNARPTLGTATITLTGTGDATDTITIWDGSVMLGTGAIVDATGHWTIRSRSRASATTTSSRRRPSTSCRRTAR